MSTEQLDLFSNNGQPSRATAPRGPDLLERTRMVLADCGIDPTSVRVGHLPGVITSVRSKIDHHTAWRAVTIARMAKPSPSGRHGMCFACTLAAHSTAADKSLAAEAHRRCRAALPLTEDCGVDR